MDVGAVAGAAVRGVRAAAGKVLPGTAGAVLGADGASSGQQVMTIGRPAGDVLAACRDPHVLSRLLGELGGVRQDAADGALVWTLGGREVATRAEEQPDAVRHTTTRDAEGLSAGTVLLEVGTAPAPADLGTEVRLRVRAPVGDLAAGAAAFTLLYRLRALLVTGEIPTIDPQPAHRAASR
ncbi:hypothetical protein [Kineococcus terrestris]|uniref:hypothetical protein n=1 Tax=Kineococcus terrestris TaxID=2044856 RepID=UPI0034DB3EE1